MAKTYRGICHTTCYWLETLWNPGEVYEGELPLCKHFSEDGKKDPELPPPDPGADPRSTATIRKVLKNKYGSSHPSSWPRRKLWEKLNEFETAQERDEATSEGESHDFTALCGFLSKSKAGCTAHERACEKCAAMALPKVAV